MKAGTNPILERKRSDSAFALARAQREGLLQHFGFRESPFGVTPDPEFLFWTRMHNGALQAIISSIESNLGFSVLLGKPGTGKTSLLFHLLAQYRDSARTAFVFQTQCKPHDLVRHIASELDLVPQRDDVLLHQKLNGMLLEEARAGRKVVIVIDEAQNLQPSSFEAVRLLSDFETGHSKLLNIVFSGSLQLGAILMTPELSQLAQRISTIARLEPFSEAEVRDYVRYRLAVAAPGPAEDLFSPESLAEIARRSEGIPRIINAICYRALMLAYIQGQASVSREMVINAADDLDLSELGRDSETAFDFRKLEGPSRSTSSSSWVPPMSERPLKPPAEAFPETVSSLGFDENGLAPSAQMPSPSRNRDIDLGGQPVPYETRERGHTRVLASIPPKAAVWQRYRSTGLVAAALLLACGTWVGWNQLRARPGTGQAGSVQSQSDGSHRPPAQPTTPEMMMDETNNGVSQGSVQQPDGAAGLSPINSSARQPSGSRAPLTDVSPNLLTPSKIPPQPATPPEPSTPNTAVSVSPPGDNLTRLATARPVASPRLEAEEISGTFRPEKMAATTPSVETTTPSRPRTGDSLQPIKVVQPEYPARAKLSHLEGVVQVELTIDPDGTVRRAHVLSGNAILGQAAQEAARQWKYAPFDEGGQVNFPTVTRIQFNFKFNSGTEPRK